MTNPRKCFRIPDSTRIAAVADYMLEEPSDYICSKHGIARGSLIRWIGNYSDLRKRTAGRRVVPMKRKSRDGVAK